MGDPPNTFGIGFGLWTRRYKLLENVTDVTAVVPHLALFATPYGSLTPCELRLAYIGVCLT